MKKLFLIAVLLSALSMSQKAKAQESCYDKGSTVISAGIGLPNLERNAYRLAYNGYNNYRVSGFGPMMVKGDYGIIKFKWGHSVGAGLVLGFSNTNVKFNYSDYYYDSHGFLQYGTWEQKDHYTTITIGARGTYHVITKEKFDLYASVGLGFNVRKVSQTTNNPSGKTISIASRPGVYEAVTVGVRYYFNPHFGVYSELGWDMYAPVQAGLIYKL